jgi:thiamine biosynthesis lipoprotein
MKSTRRQFLWLSAGASLSAGPLALLLGAERYPEQRAAGIQTASRTSWALGSDVSITALHQSRSTAKQAVDAAFDELTTVEKLMSIYRADSQLSRLNRDGVLDNPHPYFVEVLRAACALSQRSKGAFDITVQPLWALYSEATNKGGVPDSESVSLARNHVDWRRVEVGDRRIRLRGEGTAITLNGIAQGYAADRATAAIKSHGIEHALIDTGECSAFGRKKSGGHWSIGIQHPRVQDAYISIAKLDGRCLATSGDYATEFTNDHRLNHLFDPRTGRSPTELASVSICARTAMQADALSTATFVLGVDRGMKLIRETPGADALMVLKRGRTLVTKDFPLDA